MKKLLIFALVFMLMLAACNGDIPETTPPANDNEFPSSEGWQASAVHEPDGVVDEPNLEEITAYLEANFRNFTIDGSTSMLPLHQSLRNRFCDGEEVRHTRTVDSFERLIMGDVDILFGLSYSDELLQKAAERGVDLIQLPVTQEAFVFLINANNPVQSLTTAQIKSIYSGEITNWSEVGGDNEQISAFQRNADSGSQMRMVKFMGDVPIMEQDVEYFHVMGGNIAAIANFDEGSYSIAYNIYTFTEKQYPSEDVVMLAVDGVLPTDETIFDNSYPLVIYNYIYYNANNEEAAEFAEKLHILLMSEDGQKLISDSGFVNLNINFDRNTDVNRPFDWIEDSGESWLNFYNEATGRFYEPDGQGGLLIFDNYADYILRESEHINHAEAREFLTVIYNSDIRLSPYSVMFMDWSRRIDFYPWRYLVSNVEDAFTFKYNGEYFATLAYYFDENKILLLPNDVSTYGEWFEAEYWTEFVENSATEAVELSFDDLKNLYARSQRSAVQNEEMEQFVLEYFKPFN
jgi:ABC-type phosphate transport system substrate-binding protein